jgi:hypothetical protein
MTAVVEKLESDIALRELAAVATSWPERMFLEKLPAIFGSDIPVEAYRKLRQALVSRQFVPPRLELVKTGLKGHSAGYDNARRTILVHHPLVSAAERDRGQAATLLLALIEEFGHHVDNLLRTEYSRVRGDAPRDEGAEFAYALCSRWLTLPLPTTFATYVRQGQTQRLGTDVSSLKSAMARHLSAKERAADERAGSLQFFGAGRGHGKAGHSFGHESIEDALFKAFPRQNERRQIYFGNWLRDYSQILDPKLVRPPSSRNIREGLTREALVKVLDILAREEFGNLEIYRVTPEKAGVYRPEEHIDNPHGIEDWAGGSGPFRKKWTRDEVAIDPTMGLLNYIANRKGTWATSAAYIENELCEAARLGMNPEGRRRFGHALHTLEDFYAHSNFVELLLIKLGYSRVYPWVHGKVQAPTSRYPLVTGKFGSNDIQVSGAYVISEQLAAAKECIPGKRSTGAAIMLIILKDIPPEQLDPKLVKKYERFLEFNEDLQRDYPWVGVTLCELSNKLSAVVDEMLAAKVKEHATAVTKSQEEFLRDPSSTHPTHSQLAKDHDDHPLHVLAATLAMGAVRDVGEVMLAAWMGQRRVEDVTQAALKYLVQPEDISNTATDARAWVHKAATDWARKNVAKLNLLEKNAIIQRQFAKSKEEQAAAQSWYDKRYGAPEQMLAELRRTLQESERRI